MHYDEKPWLKSYDKMVLDEVARPKLNFIEFLNKGFTNDPNHIACHFLGSSFAYKEIDKLSAQFSSFLIKSGLKKGDVVGINLPNSPQYIIALTGAIRAGCIITGMSPLLTPKELIHQINDSGAKIILTLDILYENNFSALKGMVPALEKVLVTNIADYISPVKKILGKLLKKIPTGKTEPIEGIELLYFKKTLSKYQPHTPEFPSTLDDTLLLQYTGGTTGPSKGTILTHGNLMYNTEQIIQWFNEADEPLEDPFEEAMGHDIICSGFPFFHIAGLALCMQHLGLGNTQVLVPDPRNTDLICKDLKKYKPQILVNVPTLYQMLMENPLFEEIDFSNLTFALSGAAPFGTESFLELEKIIGKGKVVEVFGMTEASPILTMNPLVGVNKIGSVGIPVQNTNIKIMDVETGTKEMPVGESGEFVVQGPQVMKGYHGKADATNEALRDLGDGTKWFFTGDVAKMDEDGYIYIVDRTKDMLLVGGYNVYSKEVEDTIYEIPAVELCAIVGKPNPDRPGSEIVKAVIQLSNAFKDNSRDSIQDEITSYCRENLAPYKVPKIIEFQEELLLTAVGKIDKKVLR